MDEDDAKYVIYRTGYPSGALEYVRDKTWDDYVVDVPDTNCLEVSRGHTLSEAMNLTMLANTGQEDG